jgi:hypothetical protein
VRKGVLVAVLLLAACDRIETGQAGGDGKADVNPADRKILGVPEPYPADPALRARQPELDASQRLRRETAWNELAKVLQPIALADPSLAAQTVPRFQTWYAKDDYVRMWKQLYKDLGKDGRRARQPLDPAAIDAIFPWNAHAVDSLSTWPADRYGQYVKNLADSGAFTGEGAGHRVSYSPGVMTHLFSNYGKILDCLPKLASLPADAPPVSDDNFTACYASEFPIDAVVVKAQWVRAEFGAQVPVYDTSADGLTKKIGAGTNGDWGPGDAQADPGPDRIHTVKLANGNVFRLVGMHVMVKELRKWLWMTLWWSNDPDNDFGADRPASIAGVWRNYKMCVATASDEQDADPQGGFGDSAPSLGAALAAVNSGAGGPSWCSNPYVEKGAGNGTTNCIGCHQHGGTSLKPEQILADPIAFPATGREEVRANFPSDYLFAFDRSDGLSRVIADEVQYYDSFEH